MTNNSSSLISSIYKSRNILLEIMERQGYNINDNFEFNVNEVNAMFSNKQLDMMLEQIEENTETKRKKKIYIRYFLIKSLKPQNIYDIIEDLFNVEEILTKQFLDSPNETNASILINILSKSEYNNIVILIGKYLSNLYQHNLNIKSNVALAAYNTKKYKFSYDLYSNILTGTNLNEKDSDIIKNKKNNLAIHITNDFIKYNLEIVNKINKKLTNHIPLITFTITTCKRFDLFEKTMNSFLNCCSDINKIDSWLCVDDNSSDEDKKKMTEKYPFFTFYFKNVNEKGHPRSMNIIRSMVKTEFIFLWNKLTIGICLWIGSSFVRGLR